MVLQLLHDGTLLQVILLCGSFLKKYICSSVSIFVFPLSFLGFLDATRQIRGMATNYRSLNLVVIAQTYIIYFPIIPSSSFLIAEQKCCDLTQIVYALDFSLEY